jgi:hypothetical protein
MKTLVEIIKRATDPAVKRAIHQIWSKMPPSHQIGPTVEHMGLAGENGEQWANIHTCVFSGAEASKTYLEVGVRRGHSFLSALTANPTLDASAADMWCGEYGGEENTRKLFEQTVTQLKPGIKFSVIEGDSKITLPELSKQGRHFDMITIDGDHEPEPAEIDLQNADNLLDAGGILIFDDVVHPRYPGLKQVWEDFRKNRPLWEFSYFDWSVGTGIGIKYVAK